MENEKPKCLVISVLSHEILVSCNDRNFENRLQSMGGRQVGRRRKPSDEWSFSSASEEQTVELLARFRDLGIPLASGSSGWPPSSVFKLFLEKGRLAGSYLEAEYWGPTKGWILRER